MEDHVTHVRIDYELAGMAFHNWDKCVKSPSLEFESRQSLVQSVAIPRRRASRRA